MEFPAPVALFAAARSRPAGGSDRRPVGRVSLSDGELRAAVRADSGRRRHVADAFPYLAEHLHQPQFGFLGSAYVNVLQLNQALAGLR